MTVEDLSRWIPCPCCGAWGGIIAQPITVESGAEGLETVRMVCGVEHSALKGLPRCAWWDHVSEDRAAEVVDRGGRLGLVEGALWRWAQRRRVEAWRRARGWV